MKNSIKVKVNLNINTSEVNPNDGFFMTFNFPNMGFYKKFKRNVISENPYATFEIVSTPL